FGMFDKLRRQQRFNRLAGFIKGALLVFNKFIQRACLLWAFLFRGCLFVSHGKSPLTFVLAVLYIIRALREKVSISALALIFVEQRLIINIARQILGKQGRRLLMIACGIAGNMR